MLMILISLILVFFIVVFQVQVILSKKSFVKLQDMSPLESGFESLWSSMSISSPFFLLAVLFVLFDLELIILFPGVYSFFSNTNTLLIWGLINFIILFTLMIEWSFCGLKWQI